MLNRKLYRDYLKIKKAIRYPVRILHFKRSKWLRLKRRLFKGRLFLRRSFYKRYFFRTKSKYKFKYYRRRKIILRKNLKQNKHLVRLRKASFLIKKIIKENSSLFNTLSWNIQSKKWTSFYFYNRLQKTFISKELSKERSTLFIFRKAKILSAKNKNITLLKKNIRFIALLDRKVKILNTYLLICKKLNIFPHKKENKVFKLRKPLKPKVAQYWDKRQKMWRDKYRFNFKKGEWEPVFEKPKKRRKYKRKLPKLLDSFLHNWPFRGKKKLPDYFKWRWNTELSLFLDFSTKLLRLRFLEKDTHESLILNRFFSVYYITNYVLQQKLYFKSSHQFNQAMKFGQLQLGDKSLNNDKVILDGNIISLKGDNFFLIKVFKNSLRRFSYLPYIENDDYTQSFAFIRSSNHLTRSDCILINPRTKRISDVSYLKSKW